MPNLKIAASIFFAVFLSGCVSNNFMPISVETQAVDTTEKSIVVGRLTIQNQKALKHQPDFRYLTFVKNGKSTTVRKPHLVADNGTEGKDYIFSIESEPGEAVLNTAHFVRTAFLVNGSAILPLKLAIVFPENGITYLGHIVATIIPREGDEPRAGPIFPLIDQSVTGFANGTFVVDIVDEYDRDNELLLTTFPYLAGKDTTKQILPSWQYPDE